MKKITSRQFETLGPGRYADGDNLYLIVSRNGSRRFLYCVGIGGRRRELGFKAASIQEARFERDRLKLMLLHGIDPRASKEIKKKSNSLTFAEVSRRYIIENSKRWKWTTRRAYERTVTVDCATIAGKRLDDISFSDVKALLLEIFSESADKARRVKVVIATIFEYARDNELCDRERRSPAEGKMILPATRIVRKHHTAMHYSEVPAFVERLREVNQDSARALEFVILTASRAGEVAGARWSEFDLDEALWVVPAERMKAGKEHIVPLSSRAVEIIRGMKRNSNSGYVFTGRYGEGHLHTVTLFRVITCTLNVQVTTHGFRSSFRDWAGDVTDYAREVAEEALAHQVGNSVERAYRRGNALKKRRQMMNDWAEYLEGNCRLNAE